MMFGSSKQPEIQIILITISARKQLRSVAEGGGCVGQTLSDGPQCT
jgi:hypothetical protein